MVDVNFLCCFRIVCHCCSLAVTVEQVNEAIQLVLAMLPNIEQEECLRFFIDLLPPGSFTAHTILGNLN